jgi:hypothetical protein
MRMNSTAAFLWHTLGVPCTAAGVYAAKMLKSCGSRGDSNLALRMIIAAGIWTIDQVSCAPTGPLTGKTGAFVREVFKPDILLSERDIKTAMARASRGDVDREFKFGRRQGQWSELTAV